MSSMMAIVSKSVFEKATTTEGQPLGLGDVYTTDRYLSNNKGLTKSLTKDLYLVTVQDNELWLAAVLRSPQLKNEMWVAKPNATVVTNVHAVAGELRFETDTGVNVSKLAMSLQTPRVLTPGDVALLEQAIAGERGAPGRASPSDVIVKLLSAVLKRSEADLRNDKHIHAAYYWADEYISCLDEDFDWSDPLPRQGGFMHFDDAHSLYRDEPLYSSNIENPAFAAFMKKRDGALPMPLARQLMKAGVIEPETPQVIGQLVRGTLVDVATAVFTKLNDLDYDEDDHEVDARWVKVIDAIADEKLRLKLGCFFQDEDAARCYGAYFAGTSGGPLGQSCIGETVAAWDLGEGQGALAIMRVLEDPHPALPPAALKAAPKPEAAEAKAAKTKAPNVDASLAALKQSLSTTNSDKQKLELSEALLGRFDTIPVTLQPEYLEEIGNALAGRREPEALALFRKAVALGETRHSGHHGVRIDVIFRFAETTDQAGNRVEAIEVYTRLMKLMPDFSVLWFNRACEHAIMGNAALAVADLKRAIEMSAEWRASARSDAYFKPIRKDPAFIKLTKAD